IRFPTVIKDVSLDLSDPEDPQSPQLWLESSVHDALVVSYLEGPYAGREIAFLAAGSAGMKIVDVTDKAQMTTLSTAVYPNLRFTHQSWLSEDRRHLFINDEFDEIDAPDVTTTTTYVLNVEDLEQPFFVASFTNGLPSIDHNLMVRGRLLYEANYTSGLRIFDVGDLGAVREVGYFDTHPENDDLVFEGAWSVYTALPSGIVIVSDINRGLFVLDASGAIGLTRAGPDWTRYR
ncbi:choice-of-anchor B family protein, partial [Candidatus Sumerlaeota bacterium]|nr:choice-of-anchor B family protein [Candidatus Sumerlaeota bacterium]